MTGNIITGVDEFCRETGVCFRWRR